ncbi:tRNA lysidine(34) synthetase TilS [Lactobacillus sp. ESL0785]|uniref:tRNA lysidine(34) synthetase TilS n=1 Tax=Lactobacillus sp. ESL0785 TaxID=2983232 RepID=UPI0023F7BB21|nr:tRNA lysidine(34) synthetase TilS [Lactobacillus sp. ESL0785]WEV70598.1 tRNA lysidine(34) synthetase TilS [Lactobacillus sp. ESL0785]
MALQNKTLVLATSGGPDSMALLDMLNNIQVKYNLRLVAAHLDHRLRSDSAQETTLITDYCQDKQIEIVNAVWPKQLHPEAGVEAAARAFRYDFLLQVMHQKQGDYLLTAHHCDDLLENILLKFIRSGNPSEMNSLQAVSHWADVTLLRPLISFSKADLLTYDQTRRIAFIEDKTNNEDDVLRNRLRHHVVPLLKEENSVLGLNALRFSKQMATLTDLAARTLTQLPQPQKVLGFAYQLQQSALNSLSESEQIYYWQNFIWQTWQVRTGANLAGFRLIKYQRYFYLMPQNLPPRPKAVLVKPNQVFVFGARRLLVTRQLLPGQQCLGKFQLAKTCELIAKSLPPGAKLLLKSGLHVKSKKEFAKSGIPAILRPYCLALYKHEEPVFVEQAYRNQRHNSNAEQYYIYIDNDKKF